jgi:hypothetical protein
LFRRQIKAGKPSSAPFLLSIFIPNPDKNQEKGDESSNVKPSTVLKFFTDRAQGKDL